MNYIDYINWAKEYEEQIEILEDKLDRRKKKKYFSTPEEKRAFENTTKILYEMRGDCIRTAAILRNKAREMKEAEIYAENNIA